MQSALAYLRSVTIASACVLASLAGAQSCPPQWLPGPGTTGIIGSLGITGQINDMVYKPSTGLDQPALIVGGSFPTAGGITVNHVAAWRPNTQTWHAMGAGLPSPVRSLAVDGQRRVLALLESGPNRVMRWNGTSWQPLGDFSSFFANVVDVSVLPNSDPILAYNGFAQVIDGQTFLTQFARWNGSVWVPFASGTSNTINSISVIGDFVYSSEVYSVNRASVAGGAWTQVGVPGTPGQSVGSISGPDSNHTYAYTGATTMSGTPIQQLARFVSPGVWQAVPEAQSMFFRSNVTSGWPQFVSMSLTPSGPEGIASLDFSGTAHVYATATISGSSDVRRLIVTAEDGGLPDIYIAGSITSVNGVPTFGIARFGYSDACYCDSIDFNRDGSFFDPDDIDLFLSCYAEGPCGPNNDIDINNDGSQMDPMDVGAFLSLFSEGPCIR